MAGQAAGKKRVETAGPVRRGRPPNERAGEVEERILDAAHKVFLERGFEGASVDEIASVARAGKPTIYTRFASKEALFTEVVVRWLRRNTEAQPAVGGASLEQRLQIVATSVLRRALAPDSVNLVRIVLAEARRFPELSMNISRLLRAQGTLAFTGLIGNLAEDDETCALPAFAPERLVATSRLFLDIVLLPLVLRAQFGEPTAALESEIEAHVQRGVKVLLAACGKPTVWWEPA
jgi:AcrR family transcriptional regulator